MNALPRSRVLEKKFSYKKIKKILLEIEMFIKLLQNLGLQNFHLELKFSFFK
jgi:hypothetical protein